jgi:hypothetical protein
MGEQTVKRFDRVLATFAPRRRDDLKPQAVAWIGRRVEWSAEWIVEDGAYAGQWAMRPSDPSPPAGLQTLGWVPFCDLTDLERIPHAD